LVGVFAEVLAGGAAVGGGDSGGSGSGVTKSLGCSVLLNYGERVYTRTTLKLYW
jgi:hypothetical protein